VPTIFQIAIVMVGTRSLSSGAHSRDPLAVCRAWSTAWRWKSFIQPDGGEGLAKRKGVAARRGLKEAWSKAAARWTRSG